MSPSATTSARNTTTTDVSTLSGTINGYWDIGAFEGIIPYVGAGVGFAHLSTSDQTTTVGIAIESGSTTDNLAWSLNAGAAYELFQNTALDINYRFINLGDFKKELTRHMTSYQHTKFVLSCALSSSLSSPSSFGFTI